MNIKLYEEGHRCMECFAEFVPVIHKQQLNYIRSEVASLIQEYFNDFAPDHPPVGVGDFIDALEEVCRE